MDSVIINQLMYGIRGTDGAFTSGYVKSMETQERWGWNKEQLETFENHTIMHVVLKKIGTIRLLPRLSIQYGPHKFRLWLKSRSFVYVNARILPHYFCHISHCTSADIFWSRADVPNFYPPTIIGFAWC